MSTATGTVNIFDLIAVAQNLGKSTTSDAPSLRLTHTVSLETIQAWIDRAHAANDGSLAFQLGIANLQTPSGSNALPIQLRIARKLSQSI